MNAPKKKNRKLWPWEPRRFFAGELKTPMERERADIKNMQNRVFRILTHMGIKQHTIDRIKYQTARGNLNGALQNELRHDQLDDMAGHFFGRRLLAKKTLQLRNAKNRKRKAQPKRRV